MITHTQIEYVFLWRSASWQKVSASSSRHSSRGWVRHVEWVGVMNKNECQDSGDTKQATTNWDFVFLSCCLTLIRTYPILFIIF